MTSPRTFDEHMDGWHAWQLAPWGQLRYRIAQANLVERLHYHLSRLSIRMLEHAQHEATKAHLNEQFAYV